MNLFDQLDEIAKFEHGWCTPEKMRALASIVLALRPETVVEIGVWSGKSLIPMALACKLLGKGRVIGIDPFDSVASVEGQIPIVADWWRKVDHDGVLRFFLEKVKHFGVQDYVTFIRKRSDDVIPDREIGLLHVDGNHALQAVRDVERFAPRVAPGGIVVLDD